MKKLLTALLLLCATVSMAQTVALQAVLRDENKRAVEDGLYHVTFQLYEEVSGGTAIWSEVHPSLEVVHGAFHVNLGSIAALSTVDFDTPYWVGITVEGYDEMSPRLELTIYPYSLSVRGNSNIMPSNGNVGIGTNEPETTLDIRGGAVRVWDGVVASGAVGFSTEESDLYVEDDLEVDGGLFLRGHLYDADGTIKVNFNEATDNIHFGNEEGIVAATVAATGAFYVAPSSATPEEATGLGDLYVNDHLEVDGDIGLDNGHLLLQGPSSKIEFNDGTKIEGGSIFLQGSVHFPDGSVLRSADVSGPSASVANPANADIIANSGAAVPGANINFLNSSSTLMRLNASGNLGIGTGVGSISSRLEVQGGTARFWNGSGNVNTTYIAGSGDVYIQDDLEVDSDVLVSGIIRDENARAAINLDATSGETRFGNGAGGVTALMTSPGALHIASRSDIANRATGIYDLFVGDDAEVDGDLWAEKDILLAGFLRDTLGNAKLGLATNGDLNFGKGDGAIAATLTTDGAFRVASSSATPDMSTGLYDLYVQSDLEVDGELLVQGSIRDGNGDIKINFDETSDEIRWGRGVDGGVSAILTSPGAFHIASVSNVADLANDRYDLFVGDDLEVDENIYAQKDIYLSDFLRDADGNAKIGLAENGDLNFGNGTGAVAATLTSGGFFRVASSSATPSHLSNEVSQTNAMYIEESLEVDNNLFVDGIAEIDLSLTVGQKGGGLAYSSIFSSVSSIGVYKENGFDLGSAVVNSHKLLVDGRIVCSGMHIVSDERIKSIQGISGSATDLALLEQIEITDYLYIDRINNGYSPQKKVIAQQVKEVYPQAVSNKTDFIPNVYRPASSIRFDPKSQKMVIKTDTTHGFVQGDKVLIILGEGSREYEILEVQSEKTFVVAADKEEEEVFVYGKEVDDFHGVDYDALSMLNISATQELLKRIKALEAENEALKTEITTLRTQSDRVDALEAQMQQLLKLLPAKTVQGDQAKVTANTK